MVLLRHACHLWNIVWQLLDLLLALHTLLTAILCAHNSIAILKMCLWGLYVLCRLWSCLVMVSVRRLIRLLKFLVWVRSAVQRKIIIGCNCGPAMELLPCCRLRLGLVLSIWHDNVCELVLLGLWFELILLKRLVKCTICLKLIAFGTFRRRSRIINWSCINILAIEMWLWVLNLYFHGWLWFTTRVVGLKLIVNLVLVF